MTAQPLPVKDGWLGRLIVGIGSRLLPGHLKGGVRLTLPSGREFRIGFTEPGITCDLHLKSHGPVWSSIRRASVLFIIFINSNLFQNFV